MEGELNTDVNHLIRTSKLKWLIQSFANLRHYDSTMKGKVIKDITEFLNNDFLSKSITICNKRLDNYSTLKIDQQVKILILCASSKRVRDLQSYDSTSSTQFTYKPILLKTETLDSQRYPHLITSFNLLYKFKGNHWTSKCLNSALYDVVMFDCGLRRFLYGLHAFDNGVYKFKSYATFFKYLMLTCKKLVFTNDYYAPAPHHVKMLRLFCEQHNLGPVNHALLNEKQNISKLINNVVVICDENSEELISEEFEKILPDNNNKLMPIVQNTIKIPLLFHLYESNMCTYQGDISYRLYQDIVTLLKTKQKENLMYSSIVICSTEKQFLNLQSFISKICTTDKDEKKIIVDEEVFPKSGNENSIFIQMLDNITELPKNLKKIFILVDDRHIQNTSLFHLLQITRNCKNCKIFLYVHPYSPKYEKELSRIDLLNDKYYINNHSAFIRKQNIDEKRILNMIQLFQRIFGLSITQKKDSIAFHSCKNLKKEISNIIDHYIQAIIHDEHIQSPINNLESSSTIFWTRIAIDMYGITTDKLNQLFKINGNATKNILKALTKLVDIFKSPDINMKNYLNNLNKADIIAVINKVKEDKLYSFINDQKIITEDTLFLNIFNYIKYFLQNLMWSNVKTYQNMMNHFKSIVEFQKYKSKASIKHLLKTASKPISLKDSNVVEIIISEFFKNKNITIPQITKIDNYNFALVVMLN